MASGRIHSMYAWRLRAEIRHYHKACELPANGQDHARHELLDKAACRPWVWLDLDPGLLVHASVKLVLPTQKSVVTRVVPVLPSSGYPLTGKVVTRTVGLASPTYDVLR